MRAHIPGRYAAMALLLGGLACAHNKVETDEGSVVAQDSTKAKNDTSAYKGMERDTTAAPAPAAAPTPVDTTQYQPQAAPAPAPTPTDTSSYVPQNTPSDTGAAVQPTAPAPTPAPAPKDSSGWSKDTTKAQ
jgi:hypothetical protein